ncbi:hypothetical protein [Fervidicella metallireducens]|uniref:hypothetical protein n=1 Tax=Fervidicella metallireducens TaxID=655338 RepID=UPI0012696AA1|nr:hypothetical protein [Fervidicella metallireducens]
MKKLYILPLLIVLMLFSSCTTSRVNQDMINRGLDKANIERITITNNRYAGRYTIVGEKNINRLRKNVIRALRVSVDNKLEPDFVIDFYDNTKRLSTFKYIAGIDDKKTANLIDENGNLYHINPSIENEFIKRMMKKSDHLHVPEYYISLIEILIDKIKPEDNSTIVIDISKDFSITRSITSVEQKRILDDIDKNNLNLRMPKEVEKWDYSIKIITNTYNDKKCETVVTVTDKNQSVVKYKFEGSFERGKWSYHIKFK